VVLNSVITRFTLPPDDRLPGLEALLDTELVAGLLRAGARLDLGVLECRVTSMRYRPGGSCIACYDVTREDRATGARQALAWYGKCFTPEDFPEAYQRARSRTWSDAALGQPVAALAGRHILLFAYPNDGKLDALRILQQAHLLPKYLHGRLQEGDPCTDARWVATVVRYKPEKRAVLRCQLGSGTRTQDGLAPAVFLRVYPDSRGLTEFRTMCCLRRWLGQRADLAIPEPVAFDVDHHVLILRGLAGDTLDSLTGSGRRREAFARTAQALAALHGCNKADVPGRTVADHLAKARRVAAALVKFLPALQEQVVAMERALLARAPAEQDGACGFVHGDFHCGQVLVDGGRIGLVDFERAHTGAVAFDLGNWLASCRYEQLEGHGSADFDLADEFLEAYARSATWAPPPGAVAWWAALALFHMAIKPVRSVDANAPDKVAKLLEAVGDWLRTA
jgi:aminoglycoside phosphotransferase (APT) family kinase protein